jgi:5-methylcytosine-specific restriction endonuclease McrA
MDKREMLKLRLRGKTYDFIGSKAGVTRQRVQQLLAPPKDIRDFVIKKYDGCCAECGLSVGKSGHVHHNNMGDEENYQDIDNLQLLCISCHRKKHPTLLENTKVERNENIRSYRRVHPRASLRAMGRMFHLSHVMILKILRNGKEKA